MVDRTSPDRAVVARVELPSHRRPYSRRRARVIGGRSHSLLREEPTHLTATAADMVSKPLFSYTVQAQPRHPL